MTVQVVVGLQWGDEGKGKVVDLYTERVDVVARYAGGANAGHTIVVGDETHILHLLPSGVLHPHVTCVLGQGTVIDPRVLLHELSMLERKGLEPLKRTLLSDRAHLVMPHHILIDQLRESRRGALGTTKRGIGVAYEDKIGRRGVRVGDLLEPALLRRKLEANLEVWAPAVEAMNGALPTASQIIDEYATLAEQLRPLVCDTAMWLQNARRTGKNILLEGAQGALLDIDHGTYPFVTSSSTTAAGACTGSGLAPKHIDRVIGITKAYATRVGEGPFPTELQGAAGEALREAGREFGATTGRPRRCGWLDLPALKFACEINGVTSLAMTKLDVLTGQKTIPVCTAYRIDGKLTTSIPFDSERPIEPVFDELPGWSENLSECRSRADLPKSTQKYIAFIEHYVECRAEIISVGAKRSQTIVNR